MLTYLLNNQMETEVLWEHIEDYFLGKIPDEVMTKVAMQSRA